MWAKTWKILGWRSWRNFGRSFGCENSRVLLGMVELHQWFVSPRTLANIRYNSWVESIWRRIIVFYALVFQQQIVDKNKWESKSRQLTSQIFSKSSCNMNFQMYNKRKRNFSLCVTSQLWVNFYFQLFFEIKIRTCRLRHNWSKSIQIISLPFWILRGLWKSIKLLVCYIRSFKASILWYAKQNYMTALNVEEFLKLVAQAEFWVVAGQNVLI